jgi:hypothetical protein
MLYISNSTTMLLSHCPSDLYRWPPASSDPDAHAHLAVFHDEILNDLRRDPSDRLVTLPDDGAKSDNTAQGHYKVPYGGLFSLVSFPNYLCEWYVTFLIRCYDTATRVPLCSRSSGGLSDI